MVYCKKCDVKIDSPGEICPLCHGKIEASKEATYPKTMTKSTWVFIKRLLFANIVFVSALVLLLNRTLTPNTKWSPFVIAGLISMYVIFMGIMKGRKRVLSMMFYMCFLVIIITIGWDNLIGFKGWSLNYVMPSLAISYGVFLLVLRFIFHFSIDSNSIYIYLHVLLEFVPLVLYYKNVITFKPLAVVSAAFGLLNLVILLVFDFSHFKKDVAMRLHI